jgi:branched-chain amino acid transport system permease protein
LDATLIVNAIVSGILLGGFYAGVSCGLTLCFGLLDVPMVAHPVLIIAAGYCILVLGWLGLPVLITGLLLTPIFFAFGLLLYSLYYWSFERRGDRDTPMRGLIFFFGITFILEISLVLIFGMDSRMVNTVFAGKSLKIGIVRMPYRLVVTACCSWMLAGVLGVYLSRTFSGRAMKAAAQDQMALELVGANSIWIRQLAFALGTATAGIAGALMLIISPINPGLGGYYIGKAFAIAILAGLGSIKGTLVAGLILGLVESIVLATAGTSWTPAIAFGLLIVVFAVRPAGLFGR